jgi:hypothetical protein
MTQYTNEHNLPEAMVRALTHDDYDYERAGNISVTGLIQPPRIRQLTRRHQEEITEDVSDLIWRMAGSIGHKIVERGAPANTFSEERLATQLHGWTITGKVDLLRTHTAVLWNGESTGQSTMPRGDEYAIEDFKFRSVWAAKDPKIEDEQQLNLYALLARHNHFNVTQLRIISVLRDWSKLRASREPDYPQVGVVVREIPLWSPEEQEAFLGERVRAHQKAAELADDDLPLCTDEERWAKPEMWAVKKKGAKRASSLHSSLESAKASIVFTPAGTFEIEHRAGSYPRCLHYCAVSQFCSFGRQLKRGDDAGTI